MREVEVEDEGNDSLDEWNDNSEDVAEDGADELEDKGDERADEAADNNEEVEERLVDGSTSDLEDRAEGLEDNLWMDPLSNPTKTTVGRRDLRRRHPQRACRAPRR